MNIDRNSTNNLFILIADAQWAAGEDGENIARDLATALKFFITKGLESASAPPTLAQITAEFTRLCTLG